MFDIGFAEVMLFFIIALLVVGPERLPRLARTVGLWIGKARRVVADLRDEVEREMRVQEIKESMQKQDAIEEMKQLAGRVKSINSDIRSDLSKIDSPSTRDSAVKPSSTEVSSSSKVHSEK